MKVQTVTQIEHIAGVRVGELNLRYYQNVTAHRLAIEAHTKTNGYVGMIDVQVTAKELRQLGNELLELAEDLT